MNKGLIRLTLVLGIAAALGACGGEGGSGGGASPTPAGGGTTPPPVSAPAPKESPKASPGADKPAGDKPAGAASPTPKKSP